MDRVAPSRSRPPARGRRQPRLAAARCGVLVAVLTAAPVGVATGAMDADSLIAAASGAVAAAEVGDNPVWRQVFPGNTLLVGVVMNGVEVGAMEVIPVDGAYLVPLAEFAELAGCGLELVDGTIEITTPIGSVQLRREQDWSEVRGTRYVTQETIETKLATPVVFDEEEFALVFDLPWRRRRPEEALPGAARIEPEARPPAASVSTVRSDAFYRELDGRGSYTSNTVVDGRLAGGRWRLRYLDDLAGAHNPSEYAWLRNFGHHLVLAGQQRINLHPVLRGFEMTGAQHAWTNQPLELFRVSPEPRELLPRRLEQVSVIRGPGPPGGFAELRIDGVLVDRQPIGLSGTYEFLDVPQPARQLSRIEVFVFDRHNPTVPVAIHEQRQRTSEFLLPEGARVLLGGAGVEGNLAQDWIEDRGERELAGFYQARFGVSPDLTVETAVEQSGDERRLMAGLVTRLYGDTIVSLGIGGAENGLGYDLAADRLSGPWRVLARSQVFEAGYLSEGSLASHDHFVEIGYAPSSNLDASLIGRSRESGSQTAEFVLPAIAWRPLSHLSLRARPDSEGDYRLDALYRPRHSTRLAVSVQDRTFVDLSQDVGERVQVAIGSEHGGGQGDRYLGGVRLTGGGRRSASLTATALWAEDALGYRVAAQVELLPGVLATFDGEDDPLAIGVDGRRSRRFTVGFSIDLAFARGRVIPATAVGYRHDRGALAGRVVVEAPAGLGRFRLEDLVVAVNGHPVGRTTSGGNFFIGNLRPGLYRIGLDTESLPIELVPVDVAVVAEVAETAVTRVDLVVRPEFGIAGRVTDRGGRRLEGIVLELLDAGGKVAGSAETDRFGLYRIDGLQIGRYTLRIAAEALPAGPKTPPPLTIEVTDDYLFGQDLELPIDLGPQSSDAPSASDP